MMWIKSINSRGEFIFENEILKFNKHRPWPIPNKKWSFYQEWNNAPYTFLHNNNFLLSTNNENTVTNTSLYNTHPDSIWYKKQLQLLKIEVKIVGAFT